MNCYSTKLRSIRWFHRHNSLEVRVRRCNSSSSTVDPKEVDKFSLIGSEWWDRTSILGAGPLHAMNPVRVQFIRSSIAKLYNREHMFATRHMEGLTVLDVGCGGGLLAESLARLGAQVTAIDPSAENIKAASYHSSFDPLTRSNIKYRNSTIEEVAQSGETFDIVCALEVIEHVRQPQMFLEYCLQCVRPPSIDIVSSDPTNSSPAGSLFVSTINRTHKSYIVTILGAEYVLSILPRGTHSWDSFITPSELKDMIENIKHPIYSSMKSSTETSSSSSSSSSSGSSGSNAVCSVRVDRMRGLVMSPTNPFSGLRAPLDWKLSEKDLDINYIVHVLKDVMRK